MKRHLGTNQSRRHLASAVLLGSFGCEQHPFFTVSSVCSVSNIDSYRPKVEVLKLHTQYKRVLARYLQESEFPFVNAIAFCGIILLEAPVDDAWLTQSRRLNWDRSIGGLGMMDWKTLAKIVALFAALMAAIPLVAANTYHGDGYVLLDNGNVMRGFVRTQGNQISISIDRGSEVSLDARHVLFIGVSLESLYDYQRNAITTWGTGEHWQLSHWCIQQGLLDQAVEHYKELQKSASNSPRFKQLDLMLRAKSTWYFTCI
jgi:hypothetical protein